MIRRNPTLIAMSDVDVQQVRDAVAKHKGESPVTPAQPSSSSAVPSGVLQPLSQPFVAAEDAKRKREAMTRDERLGLA
ncbi:hypothetical protein SCP_0307490 [Sparassis crispa]|uniref:Uncharacterized protein n=1 Tax=Sparassis crispa TaxID=139825 RepID=A0A401GFR1_9APHY|nr:hypothetical protein SCP_0307490 [Sparassis crispa]GBE81026.1 hypothetical protein SCP_0307490 [Sparassis crispa]